MITCQKCESDNVVKDAYVDANTDEVVTTFDAMQCLDCGSNDITTTKEYA
jgi:hypothetical protein